MRNATITIAKPSRLFQQLYSSQRKAAFRAIGTLRGPLDSIDIDKFRYEAFIPEKPILISPTEDGTPSSATIGALSSSMPAALKWFDPAVDPESRLSSHATTASKPYLSPFGATILPYEYIFDNAHTNITHHGIGNQEIHGSSQEVSETLNKLSAGSADGAFHRFYAPLSLFLEACTLKPGPRLYIAQAQISDLPKELQDDLPIPRVVKQAGIGDVYDSNLWMGIPPTYTPLHRDPNPNLFVQIAGSKRVRIFMPGMGASIFRNVQQMIGQSSSSVFRGEEMMTGSERDALDEVVWGQSVQNGGIEIIVSSGDALFIPKGWWHSLKSTGTDITASVNWWFR